MSDEDFLGEVATIGKGILVAIILFIILGEALAVGVDVLGASGQAAITPQTGTFVETDAIDAGNTALLEVDATLGNALLFDGSDHIDASAPENLTAGDSSWTVCGIAELDESANQNGTYDIVAYENESILLQYDAGQWSAYYDNGSADARATINATDPTAQTAVCGRWNETHLVVSRGGNLSAGVGLTTAASTRNVSFEWNGTLDEIRAFNSSLSATNLNAYADDPARSLPGTNRTARFMFDEGKGSTTHVYFANVDVNVDGAEWTSGVSNPDLDAGTDYELQADPVAINVLAGGLLEGAPVVWVTSNGGTWKATLDAIASYGTTAFVLIGLALLALALSGIMGQEFFGRGGGR